MPKTTHERIKDAVRRFLTDDYDKIFCRAGDNNFEMGDGRQVAIGVYKEALGNPQLMSSLLHHNGQRNLNDWEALYELEEKNKKGLDI